VQKYSEQNTNLMKNKFTMNISGDLHMRTDGLPFRPSKLLQAIIPYLHGLLHIPSRLL
jgi:hypothetical protein